MTCHHIDFKAPEASKALSFLQTELPQFAHDIRHYAHLKLRTLNTLLRHLQRLSDNAGERASADGDMSAAQLASLILRGTSNTFEQTSIRVTGLKVPVHEHAGLSQYDLNITVSWPTGKLAFQSKILHSDEYGIDEISTTALLNDVALYDQFTGNDAMHEEQLFLSMANDFIKDAFEPGHDDFSDPESPERNRINTAVSQAILNLL